MLNMNIEWNDPAKGYQRQGQSQQYTSEPKSFLGGLFTLNKKEEDERRRGTTGHTYHSTPRPSVPRRADTVSVLPPGVKMPSGNQPEISYGADGAKYLVIPPRRSNSSSRPRQIILTSGHASPSPRRMDSGNSTPRYETRSPPRRSNSSATPRSPASPPPNGHAHRAPKIIGDPELVKQYENSQRGVARWVESVADSGSSRSSKRTSSR